MRKAMRHLAVPDRVGIDRGVIVVDVAGVVARRQVVILRGWARP